jgi:hypothetical protein
MVVDSQFNLGFKEITRVVVRLFVILEVLQ